MNFLEVPSFLAKLFKYEGVNEFLGQSDELLRTFLNKHRVGNTGDDVEKFMKIILIHKYQKNYSTGMKLCYMMYLPGELYTMKTSDKIEVSYK